MKAKDSPSRFWKRLFPVGETDKGNRIPFNPSRQYAVIRSSICTGEKVAGFREVGGDRFTEVMLIRSRQDEERFKETYHLSSVKTEY